MAEKDFKSGDLVKSLKGHDTGRIYILIRTEGEFAFVSDGEYRLLSNPKKKRQKHLDFAFSKEIDTSYQQMQTKVEKFSTDAEIKTIIKKWRAYAERR